MLKKHQSTGGRLTTSLSIVTLERLGNSNNPQGGAMKEHDQSTMQDSRTQYQPLDIPAQTQPEPGLDAKLEPKADHGADSYVGSGRLKGRKALITGDTAY